MVNKSLYNRSRSHDQDGRHAKHVKNPKNILLWNRWTDFNETWYVTSGTLAHHSLYKSLPSVDLDLFYGKVNFGHIGFLVIMEKSENRIFQEIL